MTKEVRTAIVGMGIGRNNGRAIGSDPRGRVVALCDLKEDRMADFAKELPAPVKLYTDYRQMCRDREIDAVFVGTPNQWHVPIAMEAVKHGKHVLITKPLADALAPARRLVDAAEKAGVVNMMSLSTRFGAAVRHLGRLAQESFFGELYYARARSIRRSGIPAWNLGFIQEGGGAFRDMGVHALDAVWWLLGSPQPVSVTGAAGAKFGPRGRGYWNFQTPPKSVYTQYAADDYGGGFVRFQNGIGLQIESFWASHQAPEFQIELFGTEAGAKLKPLTLYTTVDGAAHDTTVALPEKGTPSPWAMIAGHFIACILDGTRCDAPLRHGLIVQEMMEALLKSAKAGREVRLKQ
ncbi:MAG: Gfo/Idh/MocA family oxidoreductase [Kiritimatiellae bacterium]|nr:Gfo/Idh/MocA family oxidoreductase [Kiritimatiellia bacterium]